MSSLEAKENRKEWEKLFSEHYIQPVLSTLDHSLDEAMDRVANDEKQGTEDLLLLAMAKSEKHKVWHYYN